MSLREKLIEAAADAMIELPFDTLELRDWGKESVADPARVLSKAALDAILAVLEANAAEWDLATAQRRWKRSDEAGPGFVPAHPLYTVDAIAALRDTETDEEE